MKGLHEIGIYIIVNHDGGYWSAPEIQKVHISSFCVHAKCVFDNKNQHTFCV